MATITNKYNLKKKKNVTVGILEMLYSSSINISHYKVKYVYFVSY